MDAVLDQLLRAGDDPGSRDLHTWGTPREVLANELPSMLVVTEGAGVLVLDVAADKGRAWAWGPAVEGPDREERATRLLERALSLLPHEVTRISAFPSVEAWMARWWVDRGARTANLVHVHRAPRQALPTPSAAVRRAEPDDLDAVDRLHREAFPGTYLSTHELLQEAARRRLLVHGDAGYICVEVQDDGTGYVHYLAVDPGKRRRGVGRALLLEGLRWLYDQGVSEVNLTVSDTNHARGLYESAGFVLVATGRALDLELGSDQEAQQ